MIGYEKIKKAFSPPFSPAEFWPKNLYSSRGCSGVLVEK